MCSVQSGFLSFFTFDTSNSREGRILTVEKYWLYILFKSQFLQDKLWEICFCFHVHNFQQKAFFLVVLQMVILIWLLLVATFPVLKSMQSLWIDLIYYLFPGSPFESFKKFWKLLQYSAKTYTVTWLHTGFLVAILTIWSWY